MMKKKMILSAIMASVLTISALTPVGNVFSPLAITAEAATVNTNFNNKILYISLLVNPSLRMDIEGGRNYNEVNCGAYYQNSGDNQKFEATLKFTDSNGTAWYRLRPLSDYNGNMGLNINYSWGDNHGNLQLYEYSYSSNMLFAFDKASDGYSYNIRAYCGGYLDITGSYEGANIFRNESRTYSDSQKWLVTDVSTEQMTSFSFPSQPIPSSFEKGKSQIINGTISADNSPLYSVTVEIVGTQYSKTVYTSGYKYELSYSTLDSATKFGQLSSGSYVLRFSAIAQNGKKASYDYKFTVTEKQAASSSSIGTFDITKALNYAETYAESYNSKYGFYGVGGRFTYNPTSADMGGNGTDCVHFVWQILREAGLNIDTKLINVSQMRNYFKPYVDYISSPSASDIAVGDVLLTSSGHLTFVSKRDGNNVYICSHTNPRKNYRVTSFYGVIKTSQLIKDTAEANVVYGDVNGDGKAFTVSDILAIKLYIADPSSISKFNFKAADLDFDGKITNNDLEIIKLKSVGLPTNSTASQSTTSENLNISENGLSFLCGLEGFHSTCYKDSTQSSIGYGTKCPYSNYIHASGSHSITKEQAMAEMKSQINSRYAVTTRKQLSNTALTQNQFDALVSLCYNTGGGTSIISNSPLVKYLKGELTEEQARSQYSNYYVKSNGVKLQGLVNRRNKEADLFFTK